MSALVRELNFATMSRSSISSTLYNTIDWKRLQATGLFLNSENEKLIDRAQKSLDVVLDSADETQSLIAIYLRIADNCTFDLTIQIYIFTRIEEIFGLGTTSNFSSGSCDSNRRDNANVRTYGARHVVHFTHSDGTVVSSAFLRAMTNPNTYLQSSAALSLAFIYSSLRHIPGMSLQYAPDLHSAAVSGSPMHGLETLLNWTNSKLKVALTSHNTLPEVLPIAVILATDMTTRVPMLQWGTLGIIHALLNKISVTGNPQFLYELSFIVWTCSLVCNVTHVAGEPSSVGTQTTEQFHKDAVVKLLVDLLSAAPSRKVVRMVIATLHNLVRTQDHGILLDVLSTSCMRQLETLRASRVHKQAGDADFEADVKGLLEALQSNYKELSTFDRYAAELRSGTLQWGILHTEKFWKENCKFMEANDWELLKQLIRSLSHTSAEVVCVALFDLGEFARFFPSGRLVVKSLGGKDQALALIQSEDPDVQRQALQCVSKIMVNSWNMLSSKA